MHPCVRAQARHTWHEYATYLAHAAVTHPVVAGKDVGPVCVGAPGAHGFAGAVIACHRDVMSFAFRAQRAMPYHAQQRVGNASRRHQVCPVVPCHMRPRTATTVLLSHKPVEAMDLVLVCDRVPEAALFILHRLQQPTALGAGRAEGGWRAREDLFNVPEPCFGR